MKLIMMRWLAMMLMLTVVAACKKNDDEASEGTSSLKIYLTDAPAIYDSVLIDVQGVAVTGPAANEVMLGINSGVYNLLDLTNGVSTLLATGTINAGTVSQIRLILGSDNRVVINGISYPLSTPSAQQSGLKLQIHKNFVAGITYELLLDFDAHESIVVHGNGTYSLKPVIRVIETAVSGSIKGAVNPVVNCMISADNGNAVYTTYASVFDGRFILKGLPAGVYTVVLTPAAPLAPVTVSNVAVVVGNVTELGLVSLQ